MLCGFVCLIFLGGDNAGPDNLDNLRKLAEQFQKQAPGAATGSGATATQDDDDDDDVPELVPGETFEAAAEEGQATQATQATQETQETQATQAS